jgi:leader peptidase (prepilin peptidase)/N-methyltransferase
MNARFVLDAVFTMSLPEASRHAGWPAGITALALTGVYGLVAWPAFFSGAPFPAADMMAGGVLAVGLIVGSIFDLRTFRLPDGVTLPLTGLGILIAHALGWGDWQERILAAAVGFLALALVREVYWRWRGRHGLGLGDAKLFAAAGAWTGAGALASVLLWACGLALAAVAVAAARGRPISATTALPFGPFLAAGTWLVWLYGPPF